MQFPIRSPRSRKVWTKLTFLPVIDATRTPCQPLDLRSEPVFPNGPPPGEDDDGPAAGGKRAETPPESRD